MDTYPKNRQGLCIGVLSGDRILFQGPPDREIGGFKQKLLHLSGIQAPKVDHSNPSKDQKYGYASRQFMRKTLVGKKLKFVIQKKVNETEIGYVLNQKGEDASVQLLKAGLAKLRGQKVHGKNADDYIDAQQQARMAEVGVWNQDKDKTAYRSINNLNEQQFYTKYNGKNLKGIVQEISAFKCTVYFPKEGLLVPISYSDVQVVLVTDKNAKEGEQKNNGRAIRSTLEAYFLQRQVNVNISSVKPTQNIFGYLVNDEGVDIRKILIENGYAKLGKQAINTMNAEQFMQLKDYAQKALQSGKGIWKDQKITKKQASSSKQYHAFVYEVHSGDSISVFNPVKNQIVRIFFPNVRAPSSGKPYAFQSKEALRKKCIGKKVRVQVQFSKNITVKKFQGDVGENKNFIFASIFLDELNLTVWMLEQGLISIQQIRTEEDVSKYLADMKNANEKSKKQKKSLYSGIDVKIPTFNDLSGGKNKKIDSSKAKEMFQFLKDPPYLSGTIELVLNGSRFKVRFHQLNIMAIVVIDGVRCLPNQEQFTKLSEEALNHSKKHALQRDAQIKLKRVDAKGIYHASLFIANKKDYALQLLENGLAVTVSRNKNALYEDIESSARNKRIGLWKYDFNLQAIKGGEVQKQYKPVNFIKKLILIEVAKANEFYLENEGCKKPDVPQKPNPATSIKVGQLYLAQFSVDKVFYRAKIIRELKNGYEVFFIDYGNYEVVPKSKICTIDENLKRMKSPLFNCSLYGLQGYTRQACNILKDYLNVQLKVEMKQQSEDGQYRVVLYDTQNKNKCINLELIEFGEAQNTSNIPEWIKAEENARRNRQGKWNDQ